MRKRKSLFIAAFEAVGVLGAPEYITKSIYARDRREAATRAARIANTSAEMAHARVISINPA